LLPATTMPNAEVSAPASFASSNACMAARALTRAESVALRSTRPARAPASGRHAEIARSRSGQASSTSAAIWTGARAGSQRFTRATPETPRRRPSASSVRVLAWLVMTPNPVHTTR
jgi:hypothetical protein